MALRFDDDPTTITQDSMTLRGRDRPIVTSRVYPAGLYVRMDFGLAPEVWAEVIVPWADLDRCRAAMLEIVDREKQ
jgi:hypothetical protein